MLTTRLHYTPFMAGVIDSKLNRLLSLNFRQIPDELAARFLVVGTIGIGKDQHENDMSRSPQYVGDLAIWPYMYPPFLFFKIWSDNDWMILLELLSSSW